MAKTSWLIALFVILSARVFAQSQTHTQDTSGRNKNCTDQILTLQEKIFLSCPILQGPDSVRAFMDRHPNYSRNKETEFRAGSYRYEARNARFYGYKIMDGRSLILLTTLKIKEQPESVYLFQAIYFFERELEKQDVYSQIKGLIINNIEINPKIYYDIRGNPYERYFLPCGGAFNLKVSKPDSDRHVIDILWSPIL